ncbi:hypothetical protein B0H19DRAFT_1069773 [Mycena capillaripes]|nr:hypothetical protein B0H19DRAFT_1069773 [Mycena capillaripes]
MPPHFPLLRNNRAPKFIRPFASRKSAKIMLDPVTGASREYGCGLSVLRFYELRLLKSKKRSSSSKPKKEESEVEDSEPYSGAEGGEEIEAVLNAERGHFQAPSDLCRVGDQTRNVDEFIKAYSADNDKKKKAAEMASRRSKAMGEEGSDAGGSALVAEKCGRKSVSEKPAKDDEGRPAKKPRKTRRPVRATAHPRSPWEEVGIMA